MTSRQKNITYIIIAAILVAFVILVLWWLKPDDTQTPEPKDEEVAQVSKQNSPDIEPSVEVTEIITEDNGLGAQPQFVTGLERLPRSLQGTDVDGDIIIDGNKNLVVTEGLRRLFDYFLSSSGEEDDVTLMARVEAYLRYHTPEPAASEAVALFHTYVDYLKQLGDIQQQYSMLQPSSVASAEKLDTQLLKKRQADIDKLRQSLFDDTTIEAFFANEDGLNSYSLAMLEIEQNETLSESEKQSLRADYISRLPDSPVKHRITERQQFDELITRTDELKKRGASADELFAMRAELVGEAAATRLAKLDEKNADFDRRFDQYQAQKQALTQGLDANNLPAEVQSKLTAIEKQLFDEKERKRLTGYEQLKNSLETQAEDQ